MRYWGRMRSIVVCVRRLQHVYLSLVHHLLLYGGDVAGLDRGGDQGVPCVGGGKSGERGEGRPPLGGECGEGRQLVGMMGSMVGRMWVCRVTVVGMMWVPTLTEGCGRSVVLGHGERSGLMNQDVGVVVVWVCFPWSVGGRPCVGVLVG